MIGTMQMKMPKDIGIRNLTEDKDVFSICTYVLCIFFMYSLTSDNDQNVCKEKGCLDFLPSTCILAFKNREVVMPCKQLNVY